MHFVIFEFKLGDFQSQAGLHLFQHFSGKLGILDLSPVFVSKLSQSYIIFISFLCYQNAKPFLFIYKLVKNCLSQLSIIPWQPRLSDDQISRLSQIIMADKVL